MDKIVHSIAFDIAGLAFLGVAIYGFLTGHVDSAAEQTSLAMGAMYLGIKTPAGT